MLVFAMTKFQAALWKIFATSNQLLAAMVLSLAALWLLRKGKKFWFALVPAVLMLITTATNLILMLLQFSKDPRKFFTLLVADIVIIAITAYLLMAGVREVVRYVRRSRPAVARAET